MKYEVLYNMVRERKFVVFLAERYPETISIPVDGYAVNIENEFCESVDAYDVEEFDDGLDEMLNFCDDNGVEFIAVRKDGNSIDIEAVFIFKDKNYAMGYAHGSAVPVVYDIFNDDVIYRSEGAYVDGEENEDI